MPKRIQRKRARGWRMPENAVYVGRPTRWGNPFETAQEFRDWIEHRVPVGCGLPDFTRLAPLRDWIESHISELRGRDLACWCAPGRRCHADVLLELANR